MTVFNLKLKRIIFVRSFVMAVKNADVSKMAPRAAEGQDPQS